MNKNNNDNDTGAELAAWELLRKARHELAEMTCDRNRLRGNFLSAMDELNEIREAVRNLRNVSGRHHTQIATEQLFALLPKH